MTEPEYITLQKQIAVVSMQIEKIAQDILEIKEKICTLEERMRLIETNQAGSHPLLEAKIDAAWRRLEEHERKLEIVSKLEQSNKMLTWLGGILGSTVLIWLITQILEILSHGIH